MAGQCGQYMVWDEARQACYPANMQGEDSKDIWDTYDLPADYNYDPEFLSSEELARADADALDAEAAEMLRGDWNRFMEMYQPVIGRLEGFVGDKDFANRQADEARGIGLRAGTAAQQQAQRGVDRYGVGMTGNQRDQLNKNMRLGTVAGGVQASNRTRGSMLDHRLAVMADLSAAGHGVSGNALAGLGTAAANANQMANSLQQQQYAVGNAQSGRTSQIAGAVIGGLGMALL